MILLDISGADAVVRKQDTLTCGMVGAEARFRFDKIWEGLQKTAVFRGGNVTRDSLLTGDTAVIPHEVLTTAGVPLQIGVYGTDPSGTLIIPTLWADTARIHPGADPSGDAGADPTLPVWAQLSDQTEANTRELEALAEQVSRLGAGTGQSARMVTLTLPAEIWTGSGRCYAQQVEVPGAASCSQVNLTPTVAQLIQFCEKDWSFLTENDGGTVTVYLLGERPEEDLTLQASVEEVWV